MKRREFLLSSGLAAIALPRLGRAADPCPPPAVTISGGSSTSTSCTSGNAGDPPSWFTNAADGEWTAVAGGAGQTISSVLPDPVPSNSGSSPTSILAAWTGGGVDQTRGEYILCANGGHGDYPGNEAYAVSLWDADPAWRRLSDPTPQSMITFDDSVGPLGAVYADGRPRAMHSTFECFGDGRVWFPEQNSFTSPGGGTAHACISYNRDALGDGRTTLPWTGTDPGPWTLHAVPDFYGYGTTATGFGRAAWDPVGHKVWALGGNNNVNSPFYWYVNTSGTGLGQSYVYKGSGSLDNFNSWIAIAYDLRILVAGGSYNSAIWVFYMDEAGKSGDWQRVSNVAGSGFFGKGAGAVYVKASHTLAIGNPKALGGSFYKLQIPTKVSGTQLVYDPAGQWTWTSVSPGGVTVVPANNAGNNDTYSKWNIVEDMGNGQSAIVVVTDIAGPVYAYKVPVAGLV